MSNKLRNPSTTEAATMDFFHIEDIFLCTCSGGVFPRITIPARSCLAWQAGWRNGFAISMT